MTLEYEINEATQERAEKNEDVRFETARNLIRGDFPVDSIAGRMKR
jgi:hypothetical protein